MKRSKDQKNKAPIRHTELIANNFDSLPPSFSFRYTLKHQNFGLESLDKDQKSALLDTLRNLSSLSWSDLRLSHRHGLGYEKIEKD